MSKPRGHSNLNLDVTEKLSTTQIQISISGGATMTNYRELPPLILTEEEWKTIGQRMGWEILTRRHRRR